MSHLIPTADPGLRKAFLHIDEELSRNPYATSEIVEVTFPSGADSDHIIRHSLRPLDPEAIDYEVIRQEQAAIVYHDAGASRRIWSTGYVVLRCNVASAVVTLRLSTRR